MPDEKRNRVVIKKMRPRHSREEKAGFAFVAVTAGLTMILGMLYTVRHVASPFDVNYEGPEYVSAAERNAREVEAQKSRDIDGDGLTDFDELYVYRTSPYLADTDSDGMNDAIEVQAGTDPNCSGASCDAGFSNPYEIADDVLTTFDIPSNTSDMFTVDSTTSVDALEDQFEAISSLSVTDVRALLLASGVSESQINALSDDQLMELYRSVVADIEQQTESALPTVQAAP